MVAEGRKATGRWLRRVYVHLPHGLDAERYRARHREGREPDETPYGFHLAEQEGIEVIFSRDEGRWPRRLGARIQRRLGGIDVLHAWLNRRRIARADAVWTMTEGEALAIAMLAERGLVADRPIVAGTVWMVNEWFDQPPARQRLLRRLASRWAALTVHARPCLERARAELPEATSRLLPFGIATATFAHVSQPPAREGPIRIVAFGNDRTRDWGTLLEAFGGDPRFHLSIVCWWLPQEDVAAFGNVDLRHQGSMDEFRELYAAADYVAVPMKDNLFSGITVALEAAAMGKPLLATRTGGVPTYFADGEALFVPVGDAAAMRTAVLGQTAADRQTMAERGRARFLRDDYSTRGMVRRYIALTEELAAPRAA